MILCCVKTSICVVLWLKHGLASSGTSMPAAAGQEEKERLVMEYCCSPESKIGNPSNFADNH